MKIDFIIDPKLLMNLIPVASDCPKNIVFLVRWLKGLMMYKQADLIVERDKLILIIHESVNSPHWPPNMIHDCSLSKARVTLLYDRAYEWISTKETF